MFVVRRPESNRRLTQDVTMSSRTSAPMKNVVGNCPMHPCGTLVLTHRCGTKSALKSVLSFCRLSTSFCRLSATARGPSG
eukprot:6290681-Prymnesium_polylepis.1